MQQPTGKYIVVFNGGSSSLKYALFNLKKKKLIEIFRGQVDNHGAALSDLDVAVGAAVDTMMPHINGRIIGVGHRVVHGGDAYTKATRITPAVLEKIEALSELAPLHNPVNAAAITAAQKSLPRIPHYAVFDTAFHATMPHYATTYALPEYVRKMGVQRYGFHGISHEYVFTQARKKLGPKATRRTVSCHLGNGCSVTAINEGKVIDTSMGFTPLEGVPMGTRSGDIDPGIIFHLLRNGYSPTHIEKMLLHESGLAGLSIFSGDVRDLRAASLGKLGAEKKKTAKRALDVFVYRVSKHVGAYASVMGGLDCLIFTGGIGEHADYVRKAILGFITPFKSARVVVIPTDEERKIAEDVVNFS